MKLPYKTYKILRRKKVRSRFWIVDRTNSFNKRHTNYSFIWWNEIETNRNRLFLFLSLCIVVWLNTHRYNWCLHQIYYMCAWCLQPEMIFQVKNQWKKNYFIWFWFLFFAQQKTLRKCKKKESFSYFVVVWTDKQRDIL